MSDFSGRLENSATPKQKKKKLTAEEKKLAEKYGKAIELGGRLIMRNKIPLSGLIAKGVGYLGKKTAEAAIKNPDGIAGKTPAGKIINAVNKGSAPSF